MSQDSATIVTLKIYTLLFRFFPPSAYKMAQILHWGYQMSCENESRDQKRHFTEIKDGAAILLHLLQFSVVL